MIGGAKDSVLLAAIGLVEKAIIADASGQAEARYEAMLQVWHLLTHEEPEVALKLGAQPAHDALVKVITIIYDYGFLMNLLREDATGAAPLDKITYGSVAALGLEVAELRDRIAALREEADQLETIMNEKASLIRTQLKFLKIINGNL